MGPVTVDGDVPADGGPGLGAVVVTGAPGRADGTALPPAAVAGRPFVADSVPERQAGPVRSVTPRVSDRDRPAR
ncbi:hypothetical protein ABT383_40965 [Streptomyces humidus]|uniref:hypothetical protein n=1 Tax=Streptomyces humidus TaxID=52259 RepID=UPI00167CDAB9